VRMTHRPSQRLSTHTRGVCFGTACLEIRRKSRGETVRGEKMPYELQGGERRRKGLEKQVSSNKAQRFVTSGDFSPKSSNKARKEGDEGRKEREGRVRETCNYRHERHFDRRKAFLNERPFKVAKGMRDEGRKEREGRVRETHRPSRHARAAA
jgi:hypothetical protein